DRDGEGDPRDRTVPGRFVAAGGGGEALCRAGIRMARPKRMGRRAGAPGRARTLDPFCQGLWRGSRQADPVNLSGRAMRLSLVFLICPLFAGCMVYGWPSVSRTPPILVVEPDVHAFRVVEGQKYFSILGLTPQGEDCLENTPIESANHIISGQW